MTSFCCRQEEGTADCRQCHCRRRGHHQAAGNKTTSNSRKDHSQLTITFFLLFVMMLNHRSFALSNNSNGDMTMAKTTIFTAQNEKIHSSSSSSGRRRRLIPDEKNMCKVNVNIHMCAEFTKADFPTMIEGEELDCDCYNFCGNDKPQSCCKFGEPCPIQCESGGLVAGCILDESNGHGFVGNSYHSPFSGKSSGSESFFPAGNLRTQSSASAPVAGTKGKLLSWFLLTTTTCISYYIMS